MRKKIAFLMLGIIVTGTVCINDYRGVVYAAKAYDSDDIIEESIGLIQDGAAVTPKTGYSFDEDDNIAEDKLEIYNGTDDTDEQIKAQNARANNNETLEERKAACAIAIYNAMSSMEASINVADFALTRQELQDVISNVVNSNPELFYIRNGYGVKTFKLSSSDNTVIVRECLGFYEGQSLVYNEKGKATGYSDIDIDKIRADKSKLQAKRNEILFNELNDDMTEAEKIMLIHDYLALNIQYDYENYLKKKKDASYELPDSDYDIYGALIDGKAVCQGYSLAFKYLLEAAGVSNIGFANTDSHVWNTVTIDGNSYYVDCTWDDPSWDTLGNVKHNYLLLGKNDFKGHGDDFSSDRECNGVLYNSMFWKKVNSGIFYYNGNYYYINDEGKLCSKDSIYSDNTDIIKDLSLKKTDNWNYINAAKLALSNKYAIYHDSKKVYACTYSGDMSGVLYTPDTKEDEQIYGITAKESVLSYGVKNTTEMSENNGMAEQRIYTYELPDDPFNIPVTSVTVTGTDKLYIRIADGKEVYEQASLLAKINPVDATNQKIKTWTSSDNSVVKVDINGRIKGISVGEAVIKAVSDDGPVGELKVKVLYDGDIPSDDGEVLHYNKGTLLADQFYTESGKQYYLGSDGKKVRGFKTVNGNTYYFDKDGVMLTGWQTVSGAKYFFNTSGAMLKGWQKIAENTYFFNNNGVMLIGWQTINGTTYYFNADGVLLTVGWTVISGKTYYFSLQGVPVTGWQTISGNKYYFDESGVMQIGFKAISSNKYYFNDNGVMQTYWKTIGGKQYYFNDNGVMQTYWKTIGGKQYYFNDNGVMQTGFKKINKKTYYFNKKGVMQTGFKKIKKKTYYFNKKGVMQTGFKKIKKKTYYFNKKGIMQTGWKDINGKRYYFRSNGVMVKGVQTIKGIPYYFASDGHFVS